MSAPGVSAESSQCVSYVTGLPVLHSSFDAAVLTSCLAASHCGFVDSVLSGSQHSADTGSSPGILKSLISL